MAVQGPSLLGAALLLWREVQERGRAGRGLQAHRQQPPTRQGAACQGYIHFKERRQVTYSNVRFYLIVVDPNQWGPWIGVQIWEGKNDPQI